MAPNPNPARITGASWWLMEQLLALQPGTLNGGIYANKSGYHNTRAANSAGNYSVRDSEDKAGPNDKAAAYDWTFPDAQRGNYSTIARYCQRLMASGKDKADPRLDGWREWYGQTDSDAHVEGWDCRYLREITSDSSHLWHIHFSEDRGLVDNWVNKHALLSVLRGDSVAQWAAWVAGQGAGTPPPPPPPPPPPGIPQYAPGSRQLQHRTPEMVGTDVRHVQIFIGPKWCGAADARFGPNTKAGVIRYQRMRGIGADGIVGPVTWRHILGR